MQAFRVAPKLERTKTLTHVGAGGRGFLALSLRGFARVTTTRQGVSVPHVAETAGPAPHPILTQRLQRHKRGAQTSKPLSLPCQCGCCGAARERNKPYPHGRLEALHPPLPRQKIEPAAPFLQRRTLDQEASDARGAASAWPALQSNRPSGVDESSRLRPSCLRRRRICPLPPAPRGRSPVVPAID